MMLDLVKRLFISFAAMALTGCATVPSPAEPTSPLRLRANTGAIESAPILLAARDYFPGGLEVRRGAIPNLVGAENIPGVFEPGPADVATHAETQALRYSLKNPEIRIILTVTEGHYRVVARKSAGIATLADLKGKRIGTLPGTSAAYFLNRMLLSANISPQDVDIVKVPIAELAPQLAAQTIDAVAIWDPYGERAAVAIGEDLVSFSDRAVYREIFNLNTTAEKLADPVLRAEMVKLVRAIIAATADMKRAPARAQQIATHVTGFDPAEVSGAWSHMVFPASLPDDLLDVMVEEEKWLAEQAERPARSREQLAKLIDSSVLEEALR
ncbi:ABC transporter substrate-binding protein [Novosphingobium aquimarinum]|uniref:ABC transporter substrate-binding protein n=1 Tax=Novosphingobium aquimarinum TaxID=2682494 RepID=UPI001E460202|nr:ABC transporter substrate-binding protein [Novosphingobium aquimarinum]